MLLWKVLRCLLLACAFWWRRLRLGLALQLIEVVAHSLLLFKHVTVHHVELFLVWLADFAGRL